MTNLTDVDPVLVYVDAVNVGMIDPALSEQIRPYLTKVCPECERSADLMTVNQLADHICIDGNVIVACEGYWVVDPAIVGIHVEGWSDGTGGGDVHDGHDGHDIDPHAQVCRDCDLPVSDELADSVSERRAGCMS